MFNPLFITKYLDLFYKTFSDKILEEAQQHARRRKSYWNLLLIPAIIVPLVAFWVACFYILGLFHAYFYPGESFFNEPQGVGPVLTAVAPFFGAMPSGFLIGNMLVYIISPARRALNKEAEGVSGASFRDSQKGMIKTVLILVPASLMFAFLGAAIPW
ncbi:MAG: hypothetical protein ACLFP8_08820 [Alphaproteobacteria bacterium]